MLGRKAPTRTYPHPKVGRARRRLAFLVNGIVRRVAKTATWLVGLVLVYLRPALATWLPSMAY